MDHVQPAVKKSVVAGREFPNHPNGHRRQPRSLVTDLRDTSGRHLGTIQDGLRSTQSFDSIRMAIPIRTSAPFGTVTSPISTPAASGGSASEPPPTLVLLDRARQGDGSAINGLLERHRTAIRRMIDQRMDRGVQRRVDASDIVQDVMIEANRRLGDYLANPTMPFQLWLRHMAKDRLIDAHRRHRVAGNRSVDREVSLTVAEGQDHSQADLIGQLADRELTPAAAATWHELERRFAAAVEQLDDDDRKIVLLRHFEHLSTAEAAEVLGLAKPAAGMRYLRAMRRLRVLLDGGFESLDRGPSRPGAAGSPGA